MKSLFSKENFKRLSIGAVFLSMFALVGGYNVKGVEAPKVPYGHEKESRNMEPKNI